MIIFACPQVGLIFPGWFSAPSKCTAAAVRQIMPPPAASQPARTSGRPTRPVLRYDAASQPARAISPPPAPVRLEVNGVGEEDAIVELGELQQRGEEVLDPAPDVQIEPIADPIREEEVAADVDGGNRIDLRPFTDASVPGPLQGPIVEDAEGWSQIDTWDAFDCSVSSIVPMEEVPGPFRKSWASALAKVLRRVNIALAAGDQTELDRSIKWMLALPKLLLRQPRRGGERGQGSGEVAARFEAVQQSSWGSLLPPLHRDEVAEKKRRDRKRQQVGREELDPAEEEARLRKTVLALVRRGQVGRARRRVASYGIADMANPTVREAVKAKYPPRSHPMPETVLAGTCLESVPSLKDTLLNLQPGVSSGFGALRHEHLRCAAQHWEEGE